MLRSNPHREISRWHGRSLSLSSPDSLSLYTCITSTILPKPKSDKAVCEATASNIFKEFFATFVTFFQKKQVWVAVLFMLLYRLPEAQLVKLINPFLLDPKELGGLGLTTGQVGLVYGTIGILGLTIGGIIGGIVAAKGGLKKWLWPMAWSISLTCATFVYLSYYQPDSLFVINLCVFTNNSVMDLDSQLICCI